MFRLAFQTALRAGARFIPQMARTAVRSGQPLFGGKLTGSAVGKATALSFAVASVTLASPAWDVDGSSKAYKEKWEKHRDAIREAIVEAMDGGDYDGHGSYGPIFVRLAWHSSGTYDKATGTGGSNGASMRFKPESEHAANNGLNIARDRLEEVKRKFPWVSYADLWTYAGVVAIEEMGGPEIPWEPGRSDYSPKQFTCPPDGRLPDATKRQDHVREIFGRMGFTDREMVALIGAHALGKTHLDRSGFEGPWTRSPTTFSNTFFTALLEEKWHFDPKRGAGQYDNEKKDLMMLPADYCLIEDEKFREWVEKYAKDEELYFKDFSQAFSKLLALGVPNNKYNPYK